MPSIMSHSTETEARLAFPDNTRRECVIIFRRSKVSGETMRLTRRSAAFQLAGFTALATLCTRGVAADSKAQRHCLTVLYPWQADARFDFDYYRDKHLVLLRELYGKALGAMQIRKGLHKGDGSQPAFIAAVTVEILSMDAFNAAGKEHFPKIAADVANYTNLQPVGQIEAIVE